MKRQVSTTSLSYETSSKSESLQNERFVRDFLQKWSATNPKRTLTCISRSRHARSSQRVAPDRDRSHSRLHFALDMHDLCRGLPATGTNRTLVLHLHYKLARCESSSKKLFPVLHLYSELATSDSTSKKLFPIPHVYYKLTTSESSSEKLFPGLHLYYKLATSESSSTSEAPSLQNERFVRDFLQK